MDLQHLMLFYESLGFRTPVNCPSSRSLSGFRPGKEENFGFAKWCQPKGLERSPPSRLADRHVNGELNAKEKIMSTQVALGAGTLLSSRGLSEWILEILIHALAAENFVLERTEHSAVR